LVLSDFQDNSSRDRLNDTVLAIQDAGVSVFGLAEQTGRHSGKDWKLAAKTARKFATETGGQAFTYSSPQDLEVQLNRIWGDLKGSYAVRYQPAGLSEHGVAPKLKVEVRREGAEIHYPERRSAEVH